MLKFNINQLENIGVLAYLALLFIAFILCLVCIATQESKLENELRINELELKIKIREQLK